MNGFVVTAPSALKGFDCNATVTATAARALHGLGHRFAVRYVPRQVARSFDLTAAEIQTLFGAGLAVMLVQHVESEKSWTPTPEKGDEYGRNAAEAAELIGVPKGVTIWLDLEGVAIGVTPEAIISYCNNWFDRVAAAGYEAGVYVGWRAGLTPEQLYRKLKFSRYWGAYNLNRDEEPAVRGLCMKQRAPTADETRLAPFPIDGNTIKADANGDLPTLFAPDEWDGR